MNRIGLLFIIIHLFSFITLHSLEPHGSSTVRFTSYTIDDGLITNSVYSIFQDSRGLLWFGTQDGINLFDGVEFTIIGEETSVSSGYVYSITEDERGDIIISSSSGLYRYFFETEVVEPYDMSLMSYDVRKAIAVDSGGVILSLADKGIFYFNNGQLNPLLQNLKVNDLILEANKIFVASDNGLIVFDLAGGKTEQIILKDRKIKALEKQNYILWAGSDKGLYQINLTSGEVHPCAGTDVSVTSLVSDSKSRVWTGTASEGLILSECSGPEESRSFIEGTTVLSVFIDRSDNLWVGLLGHGLKKIDIHRVGFSYLGSKEGLDNLIVVSLWEDIDQSLWIGTFGGGLYHFSSTGALLEHFTANPESSGALGDNRVMSLFRDSRGKMWIGTKNHGLYYKEKDLFIPVRGSFSSIYTVTEDKRGRIWATTQGGGIHIISQEGSLQQTIRLPDVPTLSFRTMLIEDERVYLGSIDSGLMVLDLEGTLVKHYSPESTAVHGLSGAHILSIFVSSDQTLWVGTAGGGLHRYVSESDTFQGYTTQQGMPNNTVYGILEDRQGRLWTSTNKGLALISPESMSITVFTESDGLQSNEFNSGASLSGRNGILYFGGVEGLSYFDPLVVSFNDKTPETLLTGLKINNRKISVNELVHSKVLLPKTLSALEELRLTRDELVVTFDFKSLHYSEPEKNSYAYYLDGLEPNWNYTGNSPNSTYTNLLPGVYHFRYKSASSDGVWSPEKSLRVYVKPEFHQTMIFKISLVIAIVALLLIVLQWKIRKSEEKASLLEQRVQERTVDLEQALIREKKMREILNVGERMASLVSLTVRLAHNLNTPLGSSLTALSFLKTSLESNDPNSQLIECCDMALDGTKQAVQIVHQLSRASSAQALPAPVLFNLSDVLKVYISQYWISTLKKAGIACHMDLPETESFILGSISSFQEIIDSLLGNSLQHAFTGMDEKNLDKEISLKVVYSEKVALLIYKDNGKGISNEAQTKIFEPFEGSSDSGKARGIGMGLFFVYNLIKLQFSGSIVSIHDEDGACFHMKFPLVKKEQES
ncbi:sensor histidine kinase [Oceanispirochaeta crateris]|uniref:Sensor histidine kinase n=1 Tax=Oceanispirochaeta crateris TaxID=2518645 RepID=A0A5C1QLM9_9SPIO|nr:sensor histidine kinase [Oceanispirochaeta crateris]QEN09015.1 sensor histidine kinase [Oceanispirochaeta crateris]